MEGIALTAMALASTLASAALAQSAPPFGPAELAERAVHRRAVEAVIWGMPAVNYDLMLQEMFRKTSAKQNEVVYWSRPVDWKNQTLTPNPDAIYFMIFFNTKDAGPIVIDVPPANGGVFAANIDTVWQMPMEDAGPYGADKGAGGKYLILPPAHQEKAPDGYINVQAETYAGYALFRSNLASHSDADIAKAVAYGKRLKVYPLSQAANPPETRFTDAKDVLYDSTIPYDVRFFQSLDRIVQTEPWQTRDKAMIDQLRTIGIEKGKPFSPDAGMAAILNAAAAEARDFLDRKYDAGFPPFFPTARWALPAFPALIQAGSSGYAETDMYPVDARALTYSIRVHRHQTPRHRPVLPHREQGQGRWRARWQRDLSRARAAERAGRAVLVGDRLRPADARADQEHAARQPGLERGRGAGERRRLGRHLLRPRRLLPARNRTGCRPIRSEASS